MLSFHVKLLQIDRWIDNSKTAYARSFDVGHKKLKFMVFENWVNVRVEGGKRGRERERNFHRILPFSVDRDL